MADAVLADDPTLFALGGQGGDFHVIYCRLASDSLLLGHERLVVGRLLNDHPYGLFVFSNRSSSAWHFVNVKLDETSPRRQLYRRISVASGERLRTAAERLALIDLTRPGDLGAALSPLAIQQIHDVAFDVEVVQREFFQTFARLYHRIANEFEAVGHTKRQAFTWAQLALDRLLFLYFVQRKGWLDGQQDYLYARFLPHVKADPEGHSYCATVLYPLFSALASRDPRPPNIGDVPFLNGGLFDEGDWPSDAWISNATLQSVFRELLERYNFTVTEDTPFDVEVAIDPEMLGKVFESLILELEKDPGIDLRRLTGSYYTPSPVVHYMCQQALAEHLTPRLVADTGAPVADARERIDELLAFPPATHADEEGSRRLAALAPARDAQLLLTALLETKVCDPAVGSGAFLVVMLQEMLSLSFKLDLALSGEARSHRNQYYDRKRRLVENCMYGVDIQDQAIRLCELRLWLSLMVDYELDHKRPFSAAIAEVPSLPNLAYRVVRGDSLVEQLFGERVSLDRMSTDGNTRQLIQTIQADKRSYFEENRAAEKRHIEMKVLRKQTELAERLIEYRRSMLAGAQTNIFGDAGMTRHEAAQHARQSREVASLELLASKVSAAKGAIEAVAAGNAEITKERVDDVRRRYFQSGDTPTFLWRVDFAEIFGERGGFDIVISNPPYVSALQFARSYSPDYREQLNAAFLSARGAYDLFVPFFERGVSLLRIGGTLVYISPNKYLAASYAKALRGQLLETASLRQVVDVSGIRIFREAAVYPVVTILNAGRGGDYVVKAVLPEGTSLQTFDLTRYSTTEFSSRLLESLPENIWGFLLSPYSWLLPKMLEGTKQLGSVGSVNATSTAGEADAYGSHLTERSSPGALKVVNTGTIDPFTPLWGRRRMTHAGATYLTPYLPLAKAQVNPRRRHMYRSPKVIFAKIGLRCEAFADLAGEFASLNTNCFFEPTGNTTLDYVCAYCNSKVFQFIYTLLFGALRMGGGYIQYQAPQLRVMPIREANSGVQQKLADLGRSLAKADPDLETRELWDELDRHFYSIFGLTPAEIAAVEVVCP